MIVIHHSRGVLCIPKTFLPQLSLQHGVSFFFVLSGFILAYVYPSLPDRGATIRFLIARFARVWPAHIFALCVALVLGIHETNPSLAVGIANAAMVHAWVPTTGFFFSFNAVSWSISTEFFFYLAFPLLILGFNRTWWWKMLLGAALVAAMVAICSAFAIPTYNKAPHDVVNRAGLIYISPVTRMFEFILGMTTAHFWIARTGASRSSGVKATVAETGCVLVCIAAVAFFSDKGALASAVGANWASYLGHAGAAPAFALLLFVFASQRGAISKLFTHRLAVILGEISFSVYLLHQIMIRWIVSHRALWDGVSETLIYAAFWAVLLASSLFAWRFIEAPARRALVRLAPAA